MNLDNTSPPLPAWSTRQVFRGTLLVVGIGLGFGLLYVYRDALFSLFLATVISTAISPAVDWLRRHRVPPGAGVVIIYSSLLLILIGVILLLVPLLTVQGPTIMAAFGSLYAAGLAQLRLSPNALIQRLAAQLPTGSFLGTPGAADGGGLAIVNGVLGYAGQIGDGVFIIIAVFLLAFYWTLDRDRLLRWLLLFVSIERRDGLRTFIEASEAKVGAYLRGVAILCLIVGTMAWGAYVLIGLPNALLLGLLAGLLEAVPVVGPALGALPAVAVALTGAPGRVVWVLLAVGAIQLVENSFLAPRVMGRTVGVHPVVTLLSLAAFGRFFGLPGALMAIPIAAVIQLLLDHSVLAPAGAEATNSMGRGRLSVLRYDAQELVRDIRKQSRRNPETDLDEDGADLEDTIEALAADLEQILAVTASDQAAQL